MKLTDLKHIILILMFACLLAACACMKGCNAQPQTSGIGSDPKIETHFTINITGADDDGLDVAESGDEASSDELSALGIARSKTASKRRAAVILDLSNMQVKVESSSGTDGVSNETMGGAQRADGKIDIPIIPAP